MSLSATAAMLVDRRTTAAATTTVAPSSMGAVVTSPAGSPTVAPVATTTTTTAASPAPRWRASHFTAGATAGMIAAIVTCPLEVLKTRAQVAKQTTGSLKQSFKIFT